MVITVDYGLGSIIVITRDDGSWNLIVITMDYRLWILIVITRDCGFPCDGERVLRESRPLLRPGDAAGRRTLQIARIH